MADRSPATKWIIGVCGGLLIAYGVYLMGVVVLWRLFAALPTPLSLEKWVITRSCSSIQKALCGGANGA